MTIAVDRVRESEHTTQVFSNIPIMRAVCSVSPISVIRNTDMASTTGLHTSAYINIRSKLAADRKLNVI